MYKYFLILAFQRIFKKMLQYPIYFSLFKIWRITETAYNQIEY